MSEVLAAADGVGNKGNLLPNAHYYFIYPGLRRLFSADVMPRLPTVEVVG